MMLYDRTQGYYKDDKRDNERDIMKILKQN